MQISNIKILKLEDKGRLKAIATFVIDNSFAVHNVEIVEGNKGLFIAMPDKKINGEYKDICHPTNQETRDSIQSAILEEYNKIGDSNEN